MLQSDFLVLHQTVLEGEGSVANDKKLPRRSELNRKIKLDKMYGRLTSRTSREAAEQLFSASEQELDDSFESEKKKDK